MPVDRISSPPSGVSTIPLFRRGAFYESRDDEPAGAGDRMFAPRLSLAPPILLTDDARWLRAQLQRLPPLPADDRKTLIQDALRRFAGGEVDLPGGGRQNVGDFEQELWTHCGLPNGLTRGWTGLLLDQFDKGAPPPALRPGIEAVSLPSNTFTCLEACLQALLRSDALWIRPSRREPFAARRLAACLVEAGWPSARIGFYPTHRRDLMHLIGLIDRAIIYGGGELPVELASSPNVEIRGPGRARALLSADVDTPDAAQWLTSAIAGDGGRFCTNLGTILAAANVERLGALIAAELDSISLEAPGDPAYPQALVRNSELAGLEDWVLARLRPGDELLTRRPICVETAAGGAAAPTLIRLASAEGHPLLGLELPFSIAALAHVPEERQASMCEGAGFVFTLGYGPGAMSGLPAGARLTGIQFGESRVVNP